MSAVVLAMLVLYTATLTKNYHGDPIYYAMVVEGLQTNTFFPPDHLLLPTVFRAWHKLWQAFGFEGRAIVSAQWLNAIVGSCTVGVLWSALQLAVRDSRITIPLAMAAGGGLGFWWVSVDGHGYTIPIFFLTVALWLLVRQGVGLPIVAWRQGLFVGLCYGAAVALHKMALFAGPGLLLFVWLAAESKRARLHAVTAFLIVSGVVVTATYIGIAILEGHRSLSEFLTWMMHGKGSGPFGIPFHPGYVIPKFLRGFAQMFIWYTDDSSVAGRQWLQGQIQFWEAVSRSALLPLALFWLVVTPILLWLAFRLKAILRQYGLWPIALVVYCVTYFVFFAWWLFPDPWKWCYTLGPFLVLSALAARDFLTFASHRGFRYGLALVLVLWVGVTWGITHNFLTKFYPESVLSNNHVLTVAQRLSREMNPRDVLFTPYGNLASYVTYFGQRKIYSLFYHATEASRWDERKPLSENLDQYFSVVDQEMVKVHQADGRVFLEQLFDPDINDAVAPWTDYGRKLGWQSARRDFEEHFDVCRKTRVFTDIKDVWLVSSTSCVRSLS